MACCPSTIVFFSDVLTTLIAYPDTLKAVYGAKPRVDVYYFDTDAGEFYTLNDFPGSQVIFDGSIKIDHGGLASGYVKIS